MSATEERPCTEGGKRHRVSEGALQEAVASAGEDGSYTVECMDCHKLIERGPTDLTFRAEVRGQ